MKGVTNQANTIVQIAQDSIFLKAKTLLKFK